MPQDRTQLRQFNAMVNWYYRHLKNVARVQGPLHKLTSVKAPWQWTKLEQDALEQVKAALISAPPLYVPIPGQPFTLYTDASDFGLGAILVQVDSNENRKNLVQVLSRPLRGTEIHYTTTEKECLAVVWTMEKLRCYLGGMPFIVITDHQALIWLHSLKNSTGPSAPQAIYQHNLTVAHRRGMLNEAPDALSRMHDIDIESTGWKQVVEETI